MDFVKINEIVAVGSVIFFVIAPLLGYLINKYILDRYFNNDFKEYLKTLKSDLQKARQTENRAKS